MEVVASRWRAARLRTALLGSADGRRERVGRAVGPRRSARSSRTVAATCRDLPRCGSLECAEIRARDRVDLALPRHRTPSWPTASSHSKRSHGQCAAAPALRVTERIRLELRTRSRSLWRNHTRGAPGSERLPDRWLHGLWAVTKSRATRRGSGTAKFRDVVGPETSRSLRPSGPASAPRTRRRSRAGSRRSRAASRSSRCRTARSNGRGRRSTCRSPRANAA